MQSHAGWLAVQNHASYPRITLPQIGILRTILPSLVSSPGFINQALAVSLVSQCIPLSPKFDTPEMELQGHSVYQISSIYQTSGFLTVLIFHHGSMFLLLITKLFHLTHIMIAIWRADGLMNLLSKACL